MSNEDFKQMVTPCDDPFPMNSDTEPNPAPTPRTDAERHKTHACYDAVTADFARTLERELLSAQAALAAKDAEIEAFKANNRYMRGHTAGYEEARSKFEPRLRTEEVLHKAARARAEKAEVERDHWKACHSSAEAALEEMTGWRNECGFRYNQAKAERDQLRADVENIKAWANSKADEAQELRAAIAAAKEDTERLDWLEAHHDWILAAESESPTFSCGSNENFQNWALKVATVRAAIDAARKD